MDWKPNIDAGWESGSYEIYGPFPGGLVTLQYRSKPLGEYKSHSAAMRVAEAHAKETQQ